MSVTDERLFNLLPAIYRVRDPAQDEQLRALMAIVESERQRLEDDIAALYDNWFIETCAEWVVPYIGDLLGIRGLLPVQTGIFTQRPFVANTLAYRRAKGTVAVLERLARDVTDWPAKAVEFFALLATTQHLNHVRISSRSTVDLRDTNALELLGGPFEQAAHTVDVRAVERGQGKYNIPNMGLFLWRLKSYFITRGAARAVAVPSEGRYTFSPLGGDIPLFNRPRTEAPITQLAGESNVPGPLRRRPLHEELEALRQAAITGTPPRPLYFGTQPVLNIFIDGAQAPLPAEEIVICHLRAWHRPVSQTYTRPDGTTFATRVAVDPVLGRLVMLGAVPSRVEVSYAYGFSSDVGGGPYNRESSMAQWLSPQERKVTWQIGVTQDPQMLNVHDPGGDLVDTLHAAIARWNDYIASSPPPSSPFGLITIMDSATYLERLSPIELPRIEISRGGRLVIAAADWPRIDDPQSPTGHRRVIGHAVPDARRPHLVGDLLVHGSSGSDLVLDGLLVEGGVTVVAGDLRFLRVLHCTLVPSSGGLWVEGQVDAPNENLTITFERSISGPISLAQTVPGLRVVDSIVDAGASAAVTAHGVDVTVEASTIFGSTEAHTLEAGNSLFTGQVLVTRRQAGCVRFCSLSGESLTPRRFRCQPDLALTGVVDPAEQARLRIQMRPSFTSVTYADPGYAQLSRESPEGIRTGAEDGAEMGAFHHLQQPQRESNLRLRLNEYLPVGLAAGLFYVT